MEVVIKTLLDDQNLNQVLLETNGIAHSWKGKIKIGQVVGSSEKPLKCVLVSDDKAYLAETKLDS